MKLTFLGTRGNIASRSRLHRMHSALMVQGRDGPVLVDCGKDWLGRLGRVRPVAIVPSHAHEDHTAGLEKGAACAVFATADTASSPRTPARPRGCADSPDGRPAWKRGSSNRAFSALSAHQDSCARRRA